jgi:hypothetical protein
MDQHALEEWDGQLGREVLGCDDHDRHRGNEADADLEGQLHAPGQALAVALGQLEEVVAEADRAIADGHPQHDPDIAIRQIGPEQRGDREREQDQHAAHGRCALLGEEVALRPVEADGLSLALL